MIGWFVLGAWLGLNHQQQERKRAERAEQRRARAPRPVLAWSVYAVVVATMVVGGGPAVLPVMIGVGIGVFLYERKRHEEHEAWQAEQLAAQQKEAERVVSGWRAPRQERTKR